MTSAIGISGYADDETARYANALLASNAGVVVDTPPHSREILQMLAFTGSGGLFTPETDFESFAFPIGSSSCVVELWPVPTVPEPAASDSSVGFCDVLARSVIEQLQELQAVLSLNMSQLAQVLRASRPTLYEWLRGKQPSPANTKSASGSLALPRAGAGVKHSSAQRSVFPPNREPQRAPRARRVALGSSTRRRSGDPCDQTGAGA